MTERQGERIALITGGASGIGLAVTNQLLSSGWRVCVADRDAGTLARRSESASEQLQVRELDVSDAADVERWVEESSVHGLDAVVNAAGIGKSLPFVETTNEDLRLILEVNLVGTFNVCRAAARTMARRGGGAIVNISSGSGLRANAGRAAYGASKAAVELASKVMAVELAHLNIRVNTVAPGPIETALVQRMHTPTDRARATRSVPMRRYGAPEEVAEAVCFLADSSKSGYVTGETLCVDGGFFAAGQFAD